MGVGINRKGRDVVGGVGIGRGVCDALSGVVSVEWGYGDMTNSGRAGSMSFSGVYRVIASYLVGI